MSVPTKSSEGHYYDENGERLIPIRHVQAMIDQAAKISAPAVEPEKPRIVLVQ